MAELEVSGSLIERQVENVARNYLGKEAGRLVRGIRRIAAKQGGGSTIENYQLLGKRAIVVFGTAIVIVEVVTSVVGFVISRRSEQQRVERIVRRILEEEKQKAAFEAKIKAMTETQAESETKAAAEA